MESYKRISPRSIFVFEIGTGNLRCTIENLCKIISFNFSNDGKMIKENIS